MRGPIKRGSDFLRYYNPIVDREVRLRTKVSIWAYSYEFENQILVPDHVYDKLARKIDLSIDTGNRIMDKWFRKNFQPDTGMWIHSHPELDRIAYLYQTYYAHRVIHGFED